jgi:hypothetical protein
MQGKLFKLLMAVEKYLPKKLKEKVLHYVLKKKMKKMLPLKETKIINGTKVEVSPLSEKEIAKMMEDPSFMKSLESMQKQREKLWGIDKK